MKKFFNRFGKDLTGLGVMVAALAIYLPILIHNLAVHYDYRVHLQTAGKLAETGTLVMSHFLFHALTAALHRLLPVSLEHAALVVLGLSVAATALLIDRLLRLAGEERLQVRIPVVLILLTVAPIFLLFPVDHHTYFGYVGINVYHNPTILLVKPFALTILLFSAVFWQSADTPIAPRFWWGLPLLLVLSALAKPSFLIIYLPALTALLLLRAAAGQPIPWRLFLGSVLLPSLLVLVWQFNFSFSAEQAPGLYTGKSGIAWAPLALMQLHSGWLGLKLLLSLAFPLSVLLAFWRDARRDPQLLLGWLLFAGGAACTYLLTETGPRAAQGNFAWSGQLGLFLLFVASAAFLQRTRREPRTGQRLRLGICLMALLLHATAGVAFYITEIGPPERFW